MNLFDKDTVAYLTVLSGRAQQIPEDKVASLRGKRKLVCFVVDQKYNDQSILEELMSNPARMDNVLMNTVRIVSGLVKDSNNGKNTLSCKVEQSVFYRLGLEGLKHDTQHLLEEALRKKKEEEEREAAKIKEETTLIANVNRARDTRIRALLKTEQEDTAKLILEFDEFTEHKRQAKLEESLRKKDASAAEKALQEELEKLDNGRP